MAKKQTKPATKKDSKKTQSEQKAKAPKTAETITPDPITTAPAPEPAQKPDASDPICVFAFRLLRSERDLIHKATGSGKATQFVKGVVVAAARGDLDAIKAIIENGTA
ncbi:MAG: hypothetical protein KJ970_18150 [Candidatus Eisenbacteria bacterium]|uniref:Uncharacterized protein n=1 Tax=Eiseniibacteriota bacterium TaxID=2212470 RepID=A0A948W821_UNCEI|nr:hypothetical protein [Candidatus Eisenbacteria bacterium]MBU2692845.1 hypothetical protein [Candidatus Eisenbacteria bacterium]